MTAAGHYAPFEAAVLMTAAACLDHKHMVEAYEAAKSLPRPRNGAEAVLWTATRHLDKVACDARLGVVRFGLLRGIVAMADFSHGTEWLGPFAKALARALRRAKYLPGA
jgi:hypothetical protein